ncbi:MAG: hypothetical protein AABZ12_05345 [Planctomycetota bacterium]
MPKPYIVYYRYKVASEKTQGSVRQFRVYASDMDDARRQATQYANYPNVHVVRIKSA